ncbi:MAG: hypothetical protein EXX96DRAFT_553599 [Benjaminiella poitrasii]|nr:MAG: hypothetical protein EXX96DRAFT_553599 [Benjaminiella poitrasii]
MMMGITKSVAGKSSADKASSRMFEERFKYFLANNKRHKPFLIQAIGITSVEEETKKHEALKNHDHQYDSILSDSNHQTYMLFFNSLNMLSTRLNQMITSSTLNYSAKKHLSCHSTFSYQQDYKHDEESWSEAEDEYLYFPGTPFVTRPANPVSSVLDGACPENNNHHSARLPCQNHSSSPIIYNDTLKLQETECGIHLKSEGSGFFSGQFLIPHENILNWAQDQNQCDARLIQIQSICTEDSNKRFPSNYGVVNLIEPHGISIISDIDDTIKNTQILSGARTVLSKTFFESPQSVPGMSDAYMAWYSQGASFHYVSNSPFQLMPMLSTFLRDSQFPPGSMHLRDDGKLIARLVETPGQAKREAILKILDDFPRRQFVLIGDSGEIDLEIYTRIAAEYPHQIMKIYIRDVTTPDSKITRKKKEDQQQQQQQQRHDTKRTNSALSSLFHYPKRRSQSTSSAPALDNKSDSYRSLSSSSTGISSPQNSFKVQSSTSNQKKKFKSPFGMRNAVKETLAEYAIEPTLTGHRNTIHIESNEEEDKEVTGILDPHRHQKKISTFEACQQLYGRMEKARLQVPSIDIILFQDAEVLQNDTDIRSALWNMWDDLSKSESTSTSSSSSSDALYFGGTLIKGSRHDEDEIGLIHAPFLSSSPTTY